MLLVQELMNPHPTYISPETSLQQAAFMMSAQGCGALLVAEHDRLVGMITDRDIAVRCVAAGREVQLVRVRDVMTPKVLYCFEDETAEAVADNMYRNNIRRLAVLDRSKRLQGIISAGDIARGVIMWNLSGRMIGSKLALLTAQSNAQVRSSQLA